MIVVAAAVLGVCVVGYFVFKGLNGTDGASSPQAAVNRLTDAVEHQDAVGLLDSINPDEVHDVASVYSKVRERLEKAGAKGSHPDLEGALLGVEKERFTDPTFQVDRLGSNVAKVTMTGGTLDWDVVPTQSAIAASDLPGSGFVEADPSVKKHTEHRTAAQLEYTTTDNQGHSHLVEPFVMTVRRGGGWYVSATYTAAEELVEALGLPRPDFSSPATAPSAASSAGGSPEETIRGLAAAVSNKDVLGGSAYLSDNELGAVRDYASSFQSLLNLNLAASDGVDIHIDNLRTSTEKASDGLVKVNLENATGSVVTSTEEDGPETTNFAFDGACLRSDSSDSSCIPQRFKDLTGINKVFVLMAHSHGRYTISPIATVLEYVKIIEKHVPDAIVERVLNSYDTAPSAGTAAAGRLIDGKANDGGFAVYAFHASGRRIAFSGRDGTDSSLEFRVLDSNNELVSSDTYDGTYLLPKAGNYRVVVMTQGLDTTDFKFRFDVVRPKAVHIPADERISLAPYQTVAVQFDVTDTSAQYTVDVSGGGGDDSVGSTLVGPNGSSASCYSTCSLDAGHYTLYVFGSTRPSTSEVTIDKVQLGFENGLSSETGVLNSDGDSVSFTLNTAEGQSVTVELTCDLTVDCQLAVDDGSESSDSAGYGGAETVTFVASGLSTTVTVGSYAGFGSFNVTASG